MEEFERALDPVRGSDPEFVTILERFFEEEVRRMPLDARLRALAILAALIGCQGLDVFSAVLPELLGEPLTAEEVRETVYQAAAYLGLGRTAPFLKAMDEAFCRAGISLPLPAGDRVSGDRVEAGNRVQVELFGEGMRGFAESGPAETRHINRWLSGNCFGDYYTRAGLGPRERELITFFFLAGQGGCEPQLVSHARGNLCAGNDRETLIAAVSHCLPYLGYPRSLNALRCTDEAAK